jgi:hypothetical protein
MRLVERPAPPWMLLLAPVLPPIRRLRPPCLPPSRSPLAARAPFPHPAEPLLLSGPPSYGGPPSPRLMVPLLILLSLPLSPTMLRAAGTRPNVPLVEPPRGPSPLGYTPTRPVLLHHSRQPLLMAPSRTPHHPTPFLCQVLPTQGPVWRTTRTRSPLATRALVRTASLGRTRMRAAQTDEPHRGMVPGRPLPILPTPPLGPWTCSPGGSDTSATARLLPLPY